MGQSNSATNQGHAPREGLSKQGRCYLELEKLGEELPLVIQRNLIAELTSVWDLGMPAAPGWDARKEAELQEALRVLFQRLGG